MNRRVWLIVCLSFFQLALSRAFAASQGWALEQSSEIAGQMSTIWTNEAVRVNFKKYDLVLLSRAPAWRVFVYSDSTKRYCESSFAQFRSRFGQAAERRDPNAKVIKANKTIKIAGLSASEYILVRAKKSGVIDWSDKTEMWMTKDPRIPASIGNLLAEVASLPSNVGIPVRGVRTRNNGVKTKTIDTLAYHKIPIKPDTFSSPKGYTKVSDELSVLMEEDPQTLIEQQADLFPRESSKTERNALLNEGHAR